MPQVLHERSVHASPVALWAVADGAGARLRSTAPMVRVRAGVYADQVAWKALAPWDRYLARVHALARTHPRAIFSHESAAALLGLPTFGEPRDVHVYDSKRPTSRRFGDVCVHTSADGRAIERRDGLSLVSPAHTALDVMRVLPPAFALAVGDAVTSLAQGGGTEAAELVELAASQSNGRGRSRLALVLPMIDSRAESAGESVSRAVIVWSGFEPPDLQLEFTAEGHTDRVDFGWRSVRVLGESDGYEKYRAHEAAVAVERIIAEKRREDRLRRQCSAFSRWDWADAVKVLPLVQRLEGIGVPRIAPPRDALLATLSSNARSLPPTRNTEPDENHRHA